MATFMMGFLVAMMWCAGVATVTAVHWDNSAYLDDNFRLLWNVHDGSDEITFEVQVRTQGYVGLGFAARGSAEASAGADVVLGWVDGGQTYFQDRHIKKDGHGEPVVDPSQDYALLLAYENATHTVMRFQRKLVTCDDVHDMPIINDTMRIIYLYHPDEPHRGSVAPGTLPRADLAIHGVVPLQLTQRHYATDVGKRPETVRTIELRNTDVPVPAMGMSLKWCRFFEMSDFTEKHHMIKYEPLFDTPESNEYLQKIVLYECQGNSVRLAATVRGGARQCDHDQRSPSAPCNSVVATWSRGSSGLTFPQEAGFPFDSNKERFYMMVTHYRNTMAARDVMDVDSAAVDPPTMLDNSGLRIQVTPNLRIHDAGVLSIGMNPEWRHIIPPGHAKVISEGHCLDECTRQTFPAAGISIFAVLMQTQAIGKEVKLRQIREQEDLMPIATDNGVQAGYNEYRQISPPARVMPGDSMVVECSYDSLDRTTITLGGTTETSESCNVLAVYYPRQKRMTTCHSLPSLPTLLHSLGINKLSMSQPVLISSPAALAGQTLESRLLSYDWAQNFETFQRITLGGSFQAICTDARHKTVSNTDEKEYYRPRVTKMWTTPAPKQPTTCNPTLPNDIDDDDTTKSSDVTNQSQSTDEIKFENMWTLYSSGRSNQFATPSTFVLIAAAQLFVSLIVLRHQR